ncbi:MAG: monovalent cation/H(+) antiporter subunit G [Planctomycetales bacterium]
MTGSIEILAGVLLLVGGSFALIAAVGIVKLPDLFTRMQASTKSATLGVGCTLLAVAVHSGEVGVTTHAVLIAGFLFLTAPVAAHMIARAAYYVGVPLWEGTHIDELHDHRTAAAARSELPGRPPAGEGPQS